MSTQLSARGPKMVALPVILLLLSLTAAGQDSPKAPAQGVADPATVIQQLNGALRDELTAIAGYFVEAEMCANWGYHRIATRTKQRAIAEMRHAEALIERILFLEGTPTMEFLQIKIGKNVKEQLELGRQAEVGASTYYNKATEIARKAGDNTSADLFEHHLKDEQNHLDWIDAQLHMIQEIGYERYLISQVGEANEK